MFLLGIRQEIGKEVMSIFKVNAILYERNIMPSLLKFKQISLPPDNQNKEDNCPAAIYIFYLLFFESPSPAIKGRATVIVQTVSRLDAVNKATLKKSVFPLQRVAKIVASQAAAMSPPTPLFLEENSQIIGGRGELQK